MITRLRTEENSKEGVVLPRRCGRPIRCGEVLHGFIGSAERMEFTVIGDTVNRASRYCDGAQAGEILVSSDVHQHVWRGIKAESTSIPTKHEGNFVAFRVKAVK